jgi:hypothetical protein
MNVKLRYKDCFMFKMRQTELHSTVTILCQSVTIGPGTRDQGPGTRDQGLWTRDQGLGTRDQGLGEHGEFVRLRSGVHEVAFLLGFDASSVSRRKATTGFEIHGSVHRSMTQEKYNQDAACNRIYYSKVTEGSKCFERHTVHRQEL